MGCDTDGVVDRSLDVNKQVANRIVAVEDKKLVVYEGDYKYVSAFGHDSSCTILRDSQHPVPCMEGERLATHNILKSRDGHPQVLHGEERRDEGEDRVALRGRRWGHPRGPQDRGDGRKEG